MAFKRDSCGNWNKKDNICNGTKACGNCKHNKINGGTGYKCSTCNDCWTCKFEKLWRDK